MPRPFFRHGRYSLSRWQTKPALLSLLLAYSFASSAPAFCQTPPKHSAPTHPAPVAKTEAGESYVQALSEAGQPDVLQTEIRRFEPIKGKGPSVYLVAVTHIGEKSYYKQLQQFLDKQDVVLFEGVRRSRTVPAFQAGKATTGTGTTEKAKAGQLVKPNVVGATKESIGIQKKLANALNLQFQLEGIHYNRPQFRNSDMDWEAMTVLAKKAGVGTERALAQLQTTMTEGFNTGLSGRILNFALTQAESRPFWSNVLRRAMITALSDPELEKRSVSVSPDMVKLESILVAERNKIVLADLKTLLKESKSKLPKPVHSIALFYGAGHMKDMGEHLVSDLGYRATNTQWLTAIRAEH